MYLRIIHKQAQEHPASSAKYTCVLIYCWIFHFVSNFVDKKLLLGIDHSI